MADDVIARLREAGVPDRGWEAQDADLFRGNVAYHLDRIGRVAAESGTDEGRAAMLRVLLERRLGAMVPAELEDMCDYSRDLWAVATDEEPCAIAMAVAAFIALLCPEVPRG